MIRWTSVCRVVVRILGIVVATQIFGISPEAAAKIAEVLSMLVGVFLVGQGVSDSRPVPT